MQELMKKLADFCRENPHLAPRAYASAALKMRADAAKPENIRNGFQLQMLANKLDELSRRSSLPTTEQFFSEGSDTYLNDLGGMAHDYFDVERRLNEPPHNPLEGEPAPGLDLPSQAAAVKQTPESISKPGVVMGNQALIQYGGSNPSGSAGVFAAGSGTVALSEAQLIFWSGRQEEAQACTVSASRIGSGAGATFPLGNISAPVAYRPFLRVRWGSSNAPPNEALVDLLNGIQFTVAAAYLYVNASMDAPPLGSTAGSMMVSAQLGFYAIGRQSPVYRTLYEDVGILPGGLASQTYTIPTFATSVQVYSQLDGGTLPKLTIEVLDINGNNLSAVLVAAGTTPTSIQIPGNGYTIKISNKELVGGKRFFGVLIFTLAL